MMAENQIGSSLHGSKLLDVSDCYTNPRCIGALEALVEQRPRSILMVHCGLGRSLVALRKLLWPKSHFYGFDPQPNMVSATNSWLLENRVEATVWQGELLDPALGFPQPLAGTMDLILFRENQIARYLPEQYWDIFQNLATVLTPTGALIFDFKNRNRFLESEPPINSPGREYSVPQHLEAACRIAGLSIFKVSNWVQGEKYPTYLETYLAAKRKSLFGSG